MAKNDLTYPILIELDNDHYFIAKETYTRKDGTKGTKNKFVLQDFNGVTQGEFPPQPTLDDIVAEKEARQKALEDQAGVVEGEMPF